MVNEEDDVPAGNLTDSDEENGDDPLEFPRADEDDEKEW